MLAIFATTPAWLEKFNLPEAYKPWVYFTLGAILVTVILSVFAGSSYVEHKALIDTKAKLAISAVPVFKNRGLCNLVVVNESPLVPAINVTVKAIVRSKVPEFETYSPRSLRISQEDPAITKTEIEQHGEKSYELLGWTEHSMTEMILRWCPPEKDVWPFDHYGMHFDLAKNRNQCEIVVSVRADNALPLDYCFKVIAYESGTPRVKLVRSRA